MIKDTFFSFSRFGKLFYKEISENWKLYGLQVLVMYVAMAITLIWYSYTDYTSFNTLAKTNDLNVHIFTLVFWMWSWWIFICLGTSFAFKTMKGKTGRITMLMTPVTAFEKFFFRWLIYVLVLPLLILLSIWLADYTRVFVYSAIYPEMPFIEVTDFKHFVDQGDGGFSVSEPEAQRGERCRRGKGDNAYQHITARVLPQQHRAEHAPCFRLPRPGDRAHRLH